MSLLAIRNSESKQSLVLTQSNDDGAYTRPAHFPFEEIHGYPELNRTGPQRVNLLDSEIDTFDIGCDET